MDKYVFTAMLICTFLTASAQKDDTVRLNNGDRITGELKRLEYGMLQFKTSDMGTLQIEWEKIESIQTRKFFEIFLEDNSKYYGRIDSSFTESARIRQLMQMEGSDRYLDLIVKFVPIKQRIKDRIDIKVELGYQYNKGSDVSTLNSGYSFSYRNLKDAVLLKGSNVITNQRAESNEFRKQDINLSYNRYFRKSWTAGAFTTAEQNTELGLELRALVGFDAGKVVVQSSRSDLSFVGGILGNIEEGTDGSQTYNLEGKISGLYKYFVFHHPKVSLDTDFTIYPSFNVEGRIRIILNIKARLEILKDVYFNVTFYENYDNKPPSVDASKDDFGINTSLSYTF